VNDAETPELHSGYAWWEFLSDANTQMLPRRKPPETLRRRPMYHAMATPKPLVPLSLFLQDEPVEFIQSAYD
jgi:hypothetical protein